MEEQVTFESILTQARALLSIVPAEHLHCTITKNPTLRHSLIPLSRTACAEPCPRAYADLMRRLWDLSPSQTHMPAHEPSSDEESKDDGFPSVRAVAESVLDSRQVFLTVLTT